MKALLFVFVLIAASLSFANQNSTPEANDETVTVYIEVGGEIKELNVNEYDFALSSRSMSTFYECVYKGDGWRRCSKRTGRCFGTTFPRKSQCENALADKD